MENCMRHVTGYASISKTLDFSRFCWFILVCRQPDVRGTEAWRCPKLQMRCVSVSCRSKPAKWEREREMKKNRMCIQSRATVHWPDRMENFWHGLVLRIVHWRQQGTVAKFCTGKCEKKSIKCLKQTCYSIFQNFPVCDICIEFSHQKIEWKWMKVQIPTSVQICPVQNQLRPTHTWILIQNIQTSSKSEGRWRQHAASSLGKTSKVVGVGLLKGAAIAYAGIGLSRNLSATGALVVTNIDPRRRK